MVWASTPFTPRVVPTMPSGFSGKKLTGRHLVKARKMACYYAGQLSTLSDIKAAATVRPTPEPFAPSAFIRITPDRDYVVDTATNNEEGLLDLINTYDVFQGRIALTLRQIGREAYCY